MAKLELGEIADAIPSLRACWVGLGPDCEPLGTWSHPGGEPLRGGGYLCDLLRASEGIVGNSPRVLVESEDLSVWVQRRREYIVAFAFAAGAPEAVTRVHVQRALQQLDPLLVPREPHPRPLSIRALAHLDRYAPDPHAARQRLILRSGLTAEQLAEPDALGEADVKRMLEAIRDILGLDRLVL